ncbi:MAG: hypothetical protein LQ341_006457 [Variospora aurantia]|nr:MAG: hypothetical protein LQ341_006457 [Variospora aurantia]
MAVRQKGNGYFHSNKFSKSYGQANVAMASYSPPAFKLKASHAVNALRGLGLFMSLYGYSGVDFDIFSTEDENPPIYVDRVRSIVAQVV